MFEKKKSNRKKMYDNILMITGMICKSQILFNAITALLVSWLKV